MDNLQNRRFNFDIGNQRNIPTPTKTTTPTGEAAAKPEKKMEFANPQTVTINEGLQYKKAIYVRNPTEMYNPKDSNEYKQILKLTFSTALKKAQQDGVKSINIPAIVNYNDVANSIQILMDEASRFSNQMKITIVVSNLPSSDPANPNLNKDILRELSIQKDRRSAEINIVQADISKLPGDGVLIPLGENFKASGISRSIDQQVKENKNANVSVKDIQANAEKYLEKANNKTQDSLKKISNQQSAETNKRMAESNLTNDLLIKNLEAHEKTELTKSYSESIQNSLKKGEFSINIPVIDSINIATTVSTAIECANRFLPPGVAMDITFVTSNEKITQEFSKQLKINKDERIIVDTPANVNLKIQKETKREAKWAIKRDENKAKAEFQAKSQALENQKALDAQTRLQEERTRLQNESTKIRNEQLQYVQNRQLGLDKTPLKHESIPPIDENFTKDTSIEDQRKAHAAAKQFLKRELQNLGATYVEFTSHTKKVTPELEQVKITKDLNPSIFAFEYTSGVQEDIRRDSQNDNVDTVYSVASQFNGCEAMGRYTNKPGEACDGYKPDLTQGPQAQLAFPRDQVEAINDGGNLGYNGLIPILSEGTKRSVAHGYFTPTNGDQTKEAIDALRSSGHMIEYPCIANVPNGGKNPIYQILVSAPAFGSYANTPEGIGARGDDRDEIQFLCALHSYRTQFENCIKIAKTNKKPVELKAAGIGLGVFENEPKIIAKAFHYAAKEYESSLLENKVKVTFQVYKGIRGVDPKTNILVKEVGLNQV